LRRRAAELDALESVEDDSPAFAVTLLADAVAVEAPDGADAAAAQQDLAGGAPLAEPSAEVLVREMHLMDPTAVAVASVADMAAAQHALAADDGNGAIPAGEVTEIELETTMAPLPSQR
jgi:hypothetical protein